MVIETLTADNGLSDQELAAKLRKFVPSEHPITLVCRQLEGEGVLKRIKRIGKPSGNYLTLDQTPDPVVDYTDDMPATEMDFKFDKNSEHLGELQKVGFKRVGEWYIMRNHPNFSLTETGDHSQVLYALVVDGSVVYIDRSRRSLAHRMNLILNPRDDKTFNRIHGFIYELLKRGKHVEIYALEDPGTLQYAGHRISLTAGIEMSLIEHFRPTWNQNRELVA